MSKNIYLEKKKVKQEPKPLYASVVHAYYLPPLAPPFFFFFSFALKFTQFEFQATKRCVSFHWAPNDEGRTKLCLVFSIFLQLRRPSSSRLRHLRRYLLHHHRLTSFLPWRSHRYCHLRHRRPRFKHCYLLLDLFPRRHHSPLGFLPSQMHQNNWSKTSHFLHGTLSNDFVCLFIYLFLIYFIINFCYEYCRWYLRYCHRKKKSVKRSILRMCVCKLEMRKIIDLNFVLHRLESVIWQIFTSFPQLLWKRYNYFLLFI